MHRSAILTAIAVNMIVTDAAKAQRADENAVEEADDAFGTSVGDEKIGLYSAGEVRGFSPTSAGNIRIEGLSITQHGGLTSRFVSGSAIRVGLTAQGYPFLAPTGIADYTLRDVGSRTVASAVGQIGPLATRGVSLDVKLPLFGASGGLAGGVSYKDEENFPGIDGTILQAGAVLDLKPSATSSLKAFYGRLQISDDRDVGAIFVDGPYLPPQIERRDFGLDWVKSDISAQVMGAIGGLDLNPRWRLRGGLFFAEGYLDRDMSELYREVQPDGSARRLVVTSDDTSARSPSGELRSSHTFTEGSRRHLIHLGARGRQTARRFGGADVRDLGAFVIGERQPLPAPRFQFGAQTRDEVRQVTGSLGYALRWLGIGELSLGVQKTDYRKTTVFTDPSRETLTTTAAPWLYNAALAAQLSDRLVIYGGVTRGLEDSSAAPVNAVNRNEPPPALLTRQRDAGIRYALTPDLTLVAGLFDVQKPYFNLDADRVYRELGIVRHRGIEVSLAGSPLEGLNFVGGAVLLDAEVTGEAADLGIIGPKPVGISPRVVRVNIDYRLPFLEQLSLDTGINSSAGQIASLLPYEDLGDRQLRTDQRTTVDIGARYRFAGAVPMTLRGQVTNLFNDYSWDVSSSSAFRFTAARRIQLVLSADF
ncbi:TonB-dependent receptor domain-containing protein [Sphingomicrobium arenosum]|uniref:TonB-dependent receptor domain-containing protein n=1 Tax=Sphingomicrobium arenosum TaxID=2233861 RepID=UPI00223EAAED|nr:TonB-dependent receptor [Sphingomicrobium arenosum]